MSALKLFSVMLCLGLITACASNKNNTDNTPAMDESGAEELVPGSVMARIFILENTSEGDDISLETEIVEIVKNGPQSPVLNKGERITLMVSSQKIKDALPEEGDTITALLQSKEIVRMGSDPVMEWELSEIFY